MNESNIPWVCISIIAKDLIFLYGEFSRALRSGPAMDPRSPPATEPFGEASRICP